MTDSFKLQCPNCKRFLWHSSCQIQRPLELFALVFFLIKQHLLRCSAPFRCFRVVSAADTFWKTHVFIHKKHYLYRRSSYVYSQHSGHTLGANILAIFSEPTFRTYSRSQHSAHTLSVNIPAIISQPTTRSYSCDRVNVPAFQGK